MRRFYDRCGVEIKAGYKTFYGHVMSQPEADQYNGYTELIERAEASGQQDTAEFYKNLRHKYIVNLTLWDEKYSKKGA